MTLVAVKMIELMTIKLEMDNLIDDLLLIVFEKVDLLTLARSQRVSKNWRKLISSKYQNQNFSIEIYGDGVIEIDNNDSLCYYESQFGSGYNEGSWKERKLVIDNFKLLINNFSQRNDLYTFETPEFTIERLNPIFYEITEYFAIDGINFYFNLESSSYNSGFSVKTQGKEFNCLKFLLKILKIQLKKLEELGESDPETDQE